jgi:polygalacturonase
MKTLFKLFVLFLFFSCSNPKGIYYITDFGAKGDGKTNNTEAINKTIRTCNKNGGGTVMVTPGEFISGSIQLLSNVNLEIMSGAVIKGSLDTADYRVEGWKHGLVFAQDAQNISITGLGEINGNGTAFMTPEKPHLSGDFDRKYTRQGDKFMDPLLGFEDGPIAFNYRPMMMVVLMRCQNITFRDVTFADPPEWTIRLGSCDNAAITGIKVMNNLLVPNNDGIHMTNSRNVRITNCDIRTGDDAIIVSGFEDEIDTNNQKTNKKSSVQLYGNKTGISENIVVSNCVLQSRSAGIRIGYGALDMRNCEFNNIIIYGSNRGIGLFVREKGSIENIKFSNIIIDNRLHKGHWWGKGEPIHVSAIPMSSDTLIGHIKGISFNHIDIKSETGMVVYGVKNSKIQNLTFDDVKISIRKSPIDLTYGGNFDLRPTNSPKTQIFQHDIPALYASYFQNMTVKDFQVEWADNLADYFCNAIWCENFTDLTINGFKGRQQHQTGPSVLLTNGNGVNIQNATAEKGTDVFLQMNGIEIQGIFNNNSLANAKKVFGNGKNTFSITGNKLH